MSMEMPQMATPQVENPHDRDMKNLLNDLSRKYDEPEGGKQLHTAQNLDKYPNLSHEEIAEALIMNNYGELVAMDLDKFQGLDHKKIAEKLIETGQGAQVKNNFDKFNLNDSDRAEIMEKLDTKLAA